MILLHLYYTAQLFDVGAFSSSTLVLSCFWTRILCFMCELLFWWSRLSDGCQLACVACTAAWLAAAASVADAVLCCLCLWRIYCCCYSAFRSRSLGVAGLILMPLGSTDDVTTWLRTCLCSASLSRHSRLLRVYLIRHDTAWRAENVSSLLNIAAHTKQTCYCE